MSMSSSEIGVCRIVNRFYYKTLKIKSVDPKLVQSGSPELDRYNLIALGVFCIFLVNCQLV